MITFLLVRHGQTEWNRIERFRGRADLDLNAVGLEQARKTANRIRRKWKPDAIFSSPLKRALQTASAIGEETGLLARPVPALMDIDYGDWQGYSPDEARTRWPLEVDAWFLHPEQADIPNGESLLGVQKRAMSLVWKLTETSTDATYVLVSHTVVNRLVLLGILGAGLDHFWGLGQDPCAINLFEFLEGRFTLRAMNDVCHLEA